MTNFIRSCIFSGKMCGQSLRHFEVLDIESHMLPYFKLDMLLCFVGMFPKSLLKHPLITHWPRHTFLLTL